MTIDDALAARRSTRAFWITAGLLIGYVAVVTGQRENAPFADAWEHHRVLLALTQDLWHPGNPTYASDIPSIRYSPYFLVQAVLCRATGMDPYAMLSLAAVLNTLLLVLGVRALLRSFGEEGAAATALVVMVSLYGGAPHWAGSYALSDMPWHQVNPSAFSLALVLFTWTLYRRFNRQGWKSPAFFVLLPLAASAMLDHPMTGVFGLLGIYVLAVAGNTTQRVRLLAAAALLTVFVAAVCLAWPWFGFLRAVLSSPDRDYWFDRGTLIRSLFVWPIPALLCSLAALSLRRRELVRISFLTALLCFTLGVVALPLHSPLLARLPVPGLLFLHLPVALFIHEREYFRLAYWPARVRGLFASGFQKASGSVVEIAVGFAMVYCLVPQLFEICREPYLARAYVAPLLGLEDKQTNLKHRFDALLAPVGSRDVVLADVKSAWPMPSSRGRIVAAFHYEFFVPDQAARRRDVDAFFGSASEAERAAIVDRYQVKWVVLDPDWIDRHTFAALLEESAVVKRQDGLALMDADAWRRARVGRQ